MTRRTFGRTAAGLLIPQYLMGDTTLATDDFNRANETPLAGNWTHTTAGVSRLLLVSNKFTGVAGVGLMAYRNDVTPGASQWAQVVVDSDGGLVGPAVYVQTGADSGYTAAGGGVASGSTVYVSKFSAGSVVDLTTRTRPSPPYTIKLEATTTGSVTTLKLFFNGVQNGADITDSSSPHTSGRIGINGYGVSTPGTGGDDFAGGNLGSAAVSRRRIISQ